MFFKKRIAFKDKNCEKIAYLFVKMIRSPETKAITDANEAVASIAYRLNEMVAIYPITPSSPMAEWCDQWASASKPNLWGVTPEVVQLQSEGGAAGTVHGSLEGGVLTTTFTA